MCRSVSRKNGRALPSATPRAEKRLAGPVKGGTPAACGSRRAAPAAPRPRDRAAMAMFTLMTLTASLAALTTTLGH